MSDNQFPYPGSEGQNPQNPGQAPNQPYGQHSQGEHQGSQNHPGQGYSSQQASQNHPQGQYPQGGQGSSGAYQQGANPQNPAHPQYGHGHPQQGQAPQGSAPYGQPGQGYPAPGQPQPGQPGHPGQQGQPLYQAAGMPAAGVGPGQKKSKKGLWIGLGAAAAALILLLAFLIPSLNKSKGEDAKGAAGTSGSAENKDEAAQGANDAEKAVSAYFAAIKDGKATEALKHVDTSKMIDYNAKDPQFTDAVYSKTKNRPESWTVKGTEGDVEKDPYAKVNGTVKQKGKSFDIQLRMTKVGGEWKISPSYSSLRVPSLKAYSDGFSSTINGTALGSKTYSISGALPGDYEFSGINNKYFTSNKVTQTAWVDDSSGGTSETSEIIVKATPEAEKAAKAAMEGVLTKCAKDKDNKKCGSKFNAYSTEGKLEGLKISITKMPVMTFENSDSSPNRFSVDTETKGALEYNATLNGEAITDTDENLDVMGTVILKPDGTVNEVKVY